MLKHRKDSVAASLGVALPVCGGKYRVRKLPLQGYLDASARLQDLPADLLGVCFPGAGLPEVFEQLKRLDETKLAQLVTRAVNGAVPFALALVSDLSGIAEKDLREDPEIGLAGIVEIVQAVWEVNGLGNVVAALAKLKGLAPRMSDGSSG